MGFFLGYLVIGCMVGLMMYCLGEMTCYNPNIGEYKLYQTALSV